MDRLTPAPGCTLFPGFLPKDEADLALADLLATMPWRQETIRLYGRSIPSPRLQCWVGDPEARYTYSGLANVPQPWTPALQALRRRVETAADCRFNSVLLNLYRDGNESMGWHSDDEPELGPAPVIASLSLGATRDFDLRRRADHALKRRVALAHGDLLVMGAGVQAAWQHAVPKRRRVTAPRLNLTFRAILPSAS